MQEKEKSPLMNSIRIIGIKDLLIIKRGDNIPEFIYDAAESKGTPIQNGDTLVVTRVIVSRD
jgi:F420-0:gamma-glutamyl ligase